MSIWDTVDKINTERILAEEGVRYLKVTGQELDEKDPANRVYILKVEDLDNHARFSLRYWLDGKSAWSTKATLVKLKEAIFGGGLLEPSDKIAGAVVGAEVRLNDKGYPRVYEYFAAPKELVETYSEMDDQYWSGREHEE